MGRELALAYIPLAKLTKDRLSELRQVVEVLPEEDLYCDELDDLEEPPEEQRQKLLEAVDSLPDVEDCCWRDVFHVNVPDLPYTLLFTGGPSWGDDPTDAFPHFERLKQCPPIWDRLIAWAKTDHRKFNAME